jgi:recombination protein RecT
VRNAKQFHAALGGDDAKIERWKTLLMMEINRKPDLAECEPGSLIASTLEAAQFGLEFGPKQHGYLVPYKGKDGKKYCKFMPGYRGLIYSAKQSGETKELRAEAVYEKDSFEYELGLDKNLRHKPAAGVRGPLVAVYAVVKFMDDNRDFEVMDRAQVEHIKKKSPSEKDGPWVTDYDEMAKKTVIKRICKRLDLGEKVASIVQYDNSEYEIVDTTPKMLMPESTEKKQIEGEKA